jgi:acyl carrier protein
MALPVPDGDRPELDHPYVAPRNPIEIKLAEIWSSALHVQNVGIHDNFLEIGGDSLVATGLMMQIGGEFGVEMPLSLLWLMPTVAELASHLEQLVVSHAEDI